MDSLLFSLNATVPVFLLIVLGHLLRRFGLLDGPFCAVCDKLVFHLALPVMLVLDMMETQVSGQFDLKYLLFCAGVTSLVFFALWFFARRFLKDKTLIGEFVQASYRSSAAILGCAILKGLYGTVGMAPLMILGSVPLFNIYAVLVLTLEGPKQRDIPLKSRLGVAFWDILKNPIIIAIALGLLFSALGHSAFPPILDKTLSSISALATPLALLSIGASFQGGQAIAKIRPALAATGIKLLLLPALFLPLAILLGFTGEKLAALIVMLGSTTTPTSYIMARNMGHEGQLSVSVIVLTTLFSAFTLTFWLFLFRCLGYLA